MMVVRPAVSRPLHRTPTRLSPAGAGRRLATPKEHRAHRRCDGLPKECVEFAKQCMRLAYLCDDDPQLREHLLKLAREWVAMAAMESVDA